MPIGPILILLGALVAGLLPAAAQAGSFTISPTRVELPPDGAARTVTVTNRGPTASVIQVEAFLWEDSPTQNLVPTRELIAVPPVFELAPNAEQIVRLALRGPIQDGRERTFRLVIGEVPEAVQQVPGGVNFALRFNLPVFVTPPGARPAPAWSARRQGADALVTLDNPGAAHLQLTRLVVREGEGGRVLAEIEAPGYVLAGRRGSWPLPGAGRARALAIEAETNLGSLQAILPVEGG